MAVVVLIGATGLMTLAWLLDDSAYLTEAWTEANPRVGDPLPGQDHRFVWHGCPFLQPTETQVDCGTLTVPESRTGDSDAVVDLAVAVLRSTGEDPAPDPIVYLEGGPGGSAVAWHDDWLDPLTPLLQRRDLVLLDQRGAGYSSPSLACTETFEVDLGDDAAMLDALRACHDRLAGSGIDLTAYSTPEMAADVADLRTALGVEEWNLFGVSYGTRVALRTLEQSPEGVRSVVLDSVYPPDAVALEAQAANAAGAMTALFDRCRAEPSCIAAAGDPSASLVRAVERLDANPAHTTVGGIWGVGGVPWTVHGDDLVASLFGAFYDTDLLPDVPQALAAAADGNTIDALALLGEPGVRARLYADEDSDGTFFSVECREEGRTSDPTTTARRGEDLDAPLGEILTREALWVYDVCAFWDSGEADPGERAPVHSDTPALLLAGEYDPVTPPAWAEQTADGLPRSQLFHLPGAGHATITAGDCPEQLIATFLDAPTLPVDGSCVDALPGVVFPGADTARR